MGRRKLTPLGREVKKALIDKNMSQVELANCLGIKKQYLSLILYGKRSGSKYVYHIISILELDTGIITRQSA